MIGIVTFMSPFILDYNFLFNNISFNDILLPINLLNPENYLKLNIAFPSKVTLNKKKHIILEYFAMK